MPENNVSILIRSTQTLEGQADTMEFTAQGRLEELTPDGEGFLLTYREGEMGETHTTLKVEVDRITLLRTGEVGCEMVFLPGARRESAYRTPYGAIPIAVTTSKALALLGPDGGNVELEYDLDMAGQSAGTTHFRLEATPIC